MLMFIKEIKEKKKRKDIKGRKEERNIWSTVEDHSRVTN